MLQWESNVCMWNLWIPILDFSLELYGQIQFRGRWSSYNLQTMLLSFLLRDGKLISVINGRSLQGCMFVSNNFVHFFLCSCGRSTDVPGSVRGGGLFGSRFRYSGRVQREILEDPGPLRAVDGVINRTPLYRSLQRNKTRSLHNSPLTLGKWIHCLGLVWYVKNIWYPLKKILKLA